MKKIILIILSVLFFSCQKTWWEESEFIQSPNWTPDNKILFLQEIWRTKHTKDWWAGEVVVEMKSEVYLWQVDINQNYKKLGKIFEIKHRYVGFSYLSCAGDWILISGDTDTNIYAIKRSTLEKRYLGKGMFADLSPDGNKFVYVKPNKGLWIKNIDGTNDHQIIMDSDLISPVWGPMNKIATHKFNDTLYIIDTLGNYFKKYYLKRAGGGDWSLTPDTFAVNFGIENPKKIALICLVNDSIKVLDIRGSLLRWSPNGKYFIGNDLDNKWFVIKRNGTNKWYIKP